MGNFGRNGSHSVHHWRKKPPEFMENPLENIIWSVSLLWHDCRQTEHITHFFLFLFPTWEYTHWGRLQNLYAHTAARSWSRRHRFRPVHTAVYRPSLVAVGKAKHMFRRSAECVAHAHSEHQIHSIPARFDVTTAIVYAYGVRITNRDRLSLCVCANGETFRIRRTYAANAKRSQ